MELNFTEKEQLREQLLSIEQEYSTPFNSRISLENIDPQEQLKILANQLNQNDHTITCVSGIALFLMDKQEQILDQLVQLEKQKQTLEIEAEGILERNNILQDKLNHKKEKKNKVSSEFQLISNDYQMQIRNLQIKLNSKSEKIKMTKIKNDHLIQENRFIQESNEQLKQKLQELEKQLEKKKEKIQLLKIANVSSQNQCSELYEQQIKKFRKQIKDNSKIAKSLQNQLEVSSQKIIELEITINQERENSLKEIQFLNTELQSNKISLEQLSELNTSLKEKKRKLKQELTEYKKQFQQFQKEKEILILQESQDNQSYQKSSNKQTHLRQDLSTELNDIATANSSTALKEFNPSEKDIFSPDEFKIEELESVEINSSESQEKYDISVRKDTEDLFVGQHLRRASATIKINSINKNEQISNALRFVQNQQLQVTLNDYIEVIPNSYIDKKFQYQKDPIEQHFILLTQSIKINSPYMDLICTVNTRDLYLKCITDQIPIQKVSSQYSDTNGQNENLIIYIQISYVKSNQQIKRKIPIKENNHSKFFQFLLLQSKSRECPNIQALRSKGKKDKKDKKH